MKWFIILLTLVLATYSYADKHLSALFRTNQAYTDTTLQGACPDTTQTLVLSGMSTQGNINTIRLQYTVTHIDTNVKCVVFTSLDGTNWSPIDSVTATGNGSGLLTLTNIGMCKYLRMIKVSETGDSTPVVDTVWRGSN